MFYRKYEVVSQDSNGTIGNIECGLTKPSFDLILQIAEVLEIKPELLFVGDDNTEFKKEQSDKFSKDQLKRIKAAFSFAASAALDELKADDNNTTQK